jgi:hypothetical protein
MAGNESESALARIGSTSRPTHVRSARRQRAPLLGRAIRHIEALRQNGIRRLFVACSYCYHQIEFNVDNTRKGGLSFARRLPDLQVLRRCFTFVGHFIVFNALPLIECA